jgi:hypothetical protein
MASHTPQPQQALVSTANSSSPSKRPGKPKFLGKEHQAALAKHYEKWFGTHHLVLYHERLSEGVHMDTYIYPPTVDRPFITAATMGMSAKRASCGHGADRGHMMRAELLMYLEPNWDFGSNIGGIPAVLLNYIGRYPHVNKDSFNVYYSYEAPARPVVEGSLLTDLFIRKPVLENLDGDMRDFSNCRLPNGEICHLFWLTPITMEECYVKRAEGWGKLEELLIDNSYFTLDVDRQSFVGTENRAQRRARAKVQRLRAKRPPVKGVTNLECIACGQRHE